MTTKIFNIVIFLFLTLGLFAQRNTGLTSTTSSNLLNQSVEAKNFGLSIVKAYIEFNCTYPYSKLANELTVFETGIKITKASVTQNSFCANSPLRTDMRVTYQQYLDNYTPLVLDYKQFSMKYPTIQNLLKLQPGDFYFGGNILKPGGLELFKASDAVRFVIRKDASGSFQIIML
jgi:hypothetical protein